MITSRKIQQAHSSIYRLFKRPATEAYSSSSSSKVDETKSTNLQHPEEKISLVMLMKYQRTVEIIFDDLLVSKTIKQQMIATMLTILACRIILFCMNEESTIRVFNSGFCLMMLASLINKPLFSASYLNIKNCEILNDISSKLMLAPKFKMGESLLSTFKKLLSLQNTINQKINHTPQIFVDELAKSKSSLLATAKKSHAIIEHRLGNSPWVSGFLHDVGYLSSRYFAGSIPIAKSLAYLLAKSSILKITPLANFVFDHVTVNSVGINFINDYYIVMCSTNLFRGNETLSQVRNKVYLRKKENLENIFDIFEYPDTRASLFMEFWYEKYQGAQFFAPPAKTILEYIGSEKALKSYDIDYSIDPSLRRPTFNF